MERGPGAGSMSMAGADIRVTAPHISWWPGPVAAAGRLYGGPSVGTWGQGGLWESGGEEERRKLGWEGGQ